MIVLFAAQVQNDDISRCFFIFSKFWFSGLLGGGDVKGGVKGQKMAQNDKKVVSLCISGIVPYMVVVFGTHV